MLRTCVFFCHLKASLSFQRSLPTICILPIISLTGTSAISNPNCLRKWVQLRWCSSNMEWVCSRCTYTNRNHNSCEICSVDRSPGSGGITLGDDDSIPEWSCLNCTFINAFHVSICEMCGGLRPDLSSEDPKAQKDRILKTTRFWPLRNQTPSNAAPEPKLVDKSNTESSPFSNSRKRKAEKQKDESANGNTELKNANTLLGSLHLERLARQGGISPTTGNAIMASNSLRACSSSRISNDCGKLMQPIVILTYNVWFQDLEVDKRMGAIANIIHEHKPHVIFFQEVTPNIYGIFRKSSWWSEYKCSVPSELAVKRAYFCLQFSKLPVAAFHRNPFRNSIMGRELCLAELDIGSTSQLVVATTHLESPCPAPPTWNQMFSVERVVQANESVSLLKSYPNVIFGGDMNWDDKLDGLPPLPDGWVDVWPKLHPNQPGFTYDSKANPMLTGSRLQKRLDRFFCHLQDFEIECIEMVGLKAIPNLTYNKEKKVKKQTQLLTLPVLPSDHFGLLLKITSKGYAKHA